MNIYDKLEINTINLQERIIELLTLEGEIKATLYYKLEKTFCGPKTKFKLKKSDLFSCLIQMMKEKKIEIIIPELFEIDWQSRYYNNLKYLQDGYYFSRTFSDLSNETFQSYGENRYFFDSRQLDFNSKDENIYSENILRSIIKKIPFIKNKIIVYHSHESMPLNIYEKFEGTSIVKFLDFKTAPQLNPDNKIVIPIEKQEADLTVIKTYRTNYMCMYITLIESIHKAIINVQLDSKNLKESNKIIHELIEKFGYYCYLYVKSDWIDVKPSPYKWESFFNAFGLPFKVLELSFKNIKFHGRTFEFWIVFRYCVFIKRKFREIINELLNSGFETFESESNKDFIAIGVDHEISLPCPSIEYFYFTCKYIFYYHAFYLFNRAFHSLEGTKFTEKEKDLFKRFLPIMNTFFGVSEEKPLKKLVFKFYTFDPEELETIYNNFLLDNVKEIEKKMFSYFLIKYKK